MQNTKMLNRDIIKYLAMFTMLLNHISTVLIHNSPVIDYIFKNIGYFTAITMCYFLVEGYKYTRSRKKYGQRLFVFGLISQFPFALAFSTGTVISYVSFNMFFTLFLCFCLLNVLEKNKRGFARGLKIFGLLILSAFCDWPFLAVMFTLLFALAKDDEAKKKVAFIMSGISFAAFTYLTEIMIYADTKSAIINTIGAVAGMSLAAVTILFLYNGKRMEKHQNFSKCFFYLFYPVHLVVIGIIRVALFL